jgi:hypothetical protein
MNQPRGITAQYRKCRIAKSFTSQSSLRLLARESEVLLCDHQQGPLVMEADGGDLGVTDFPSLVTNRIGAARFLYLVRVARRGTCFGETFFFGS